MREAIEKVIAELEVEQDKADSHKEYAIADYEMGVCAGRYVAYSIAIRKLKKVIADDPNSQSEQPSTDTK